jgi:S1-C subfamily serine protease
MKKEKSFRVFVIYALLLQFAVLASQNQIINSSLPATVKNYNARDATVQVIISFADIADEQSSIVAYSGTGTIIASNDDDVYVLTARHVCAPDTSTRARMLGMIPVVEIQDSSGEYHASEISLVSDTDDLCIVKYESNNAHLAMVASISNNEPTLDTPAFAYAAPSGFYVPSAITRFRGTFAGNASLHYGQVSGVYTIPATGGSSGAAIINKDGEIIGVIHSTLVDFHHISLASTYHRTISFIEELEAQENIIIID